MLICVARSILCRTVTNRIFVSHFGVKTNIAAVLYLHLYKSNIKPEWLLMGLNFLSNYDTEELNSTRFGCDEKTFRSYCWKVVEEILKMNFICFEKRNLYGNEGYAIRMSINGTDCHVMEPQPFNEKWYSHKFKGPGIRYEVGVALNGPIVWIHGRFPCGE